MAGLGFSVTTPGIPLRGFVFPGDICPPGQFKNWTFPVTATGPGPNNPIIPGLFPLTIPSTGFSTPPGMIDIYTGIFTIPGTSQTYSMEVNVLLVIDNLDVTITGYDLLLVKKLNPIGFVLSSSNATNTNQIGGTYTIQVNSGDEFTIDANMTMSDCLSSLNIITTGFLFNASLKPI